MNYVEKRYKLKTEQLKANKHHSKLPYVKLIGQTAKKISEKNSKQLNIQDYHSICRVVYGKSNYVLARAVKRMMSEVEAKQKIDNELISIYANAGLDKTAIQDLISDIKTWIKEKKDIGNAIKMLEKLEKMHNLDKSNSIQATQTATFSNFSDLREGKPTKISPITVKVTQTAQLDAISDTISSGDVVEDSQESVSSVKSDTSGSAETGLKEKEVSSDHKEESANLRRE